MTDIEEKLIRVGEALARSIGHSVGCPKVAASIPCTCGAGRQQAEALDDWCHLVKSTLAEQVDEERR